MDCDNCRATDASQCAAVRFEDGKVNVLGFPTTRLARLCPECVKKSTSFTGRGATQVFWPTVSLPCFEAPTRAARRERIILDAKRDS